MAVARTGVGCTGVGCTGVGRIRPGRTPVARTAADRMSAGRMAPARTEAGRRTAPDRIRLVRAVAGRMRVLVHQEKAVGPRETTAHKGTAQRHSVVVRLGRNQARTTRAAGIRIR